MERRSVLSAFTAACIGVLLDGPCAEFVRADNAGQGGALLAAGPSHFETSQVEVSGSTVPCNPCKQPSVAAAALEPQERKLEASYVSGAELYVDGGVAQI